MIPEPKLTKRLMDPDSWLNAINSPLVLTIFILILIYHLLIVMMYAVYRFQISGSDLISMTAPVFSSDIDHANLTSPRSLNVLLLAIRLSGGFTGIVAVVLLFNVYSLSKTLWQLILVILGVQAVLLLLEAFMSGIGARFSKSLASNFRGLARLILFIYQPIFLFYESFKPKNMRSNVLFSDVESSLREWMDKQPDDAPLKVDERKMVRSILHFNDTLIREIMIPRIEMTAIDVESNLDHAAEQVLSSGHSRLPVYEDEIDNIIGVLYAKDLLKIYRESSPDGEVDLVSLLRPALFVPEAKKAGELLTEMQASGIHMVIVVDEYGGTAGLVSMEDIVEEIVGEIRDEFDQTEDELVQQIGENEYSFLGRIDLEDVNEILHMHITRDAADTLAGFMYSKIGKVPAGGEIIVEEGWEFQVERLAGNRILRVHVKPAAPANDETEQEANEENDIRN